MKNVREVLRSNWYKSIYNDVLPVLSRRVSQAIESAGISKIDKPLEEIRMRADRPLILQNFNTEWFIGNEGRLTDSCVDCFIVSQDDIRNTIELMSENSIYAYQDEVKNGYITIKGGHRVGLSGRVIADGATVRNIKDISGINIRLSNQLIGCSDNVLPYIIKNERDIYNTLVISPPQCGKTTLLRDIARALSDGSERFGFKGVKVGIVDERSELAACVKGIPQNNVGMRTDVLDSCPKSVGMRMIIRSMSPKVVITDEIGNDGDRDAVHSVMNAGVRIVASAHGYNVSELKSRREVLRMIEDQVFERYIVLGNSKGPGTLLEVIDGRSMKIIAGESIYAV